MTAVSAHELVVTVFCKESGCEEMAADRRGRYAGLCPAHKQARIAADHEQRVAAGGAAWKPKSELAAAADELKRQARRVDRASRHLDESRAELRRAYLQFGVAAGFLSPRGDR